MGRNVFITLNKGDKPFKYKNTGGNFMTGLKKQVVRTVQYLILNRKRGDEQIVMKLILIGVAIVLGVLFKDEVIIIVGSAMDSFSTRISALIAQ